MIEMSSIPIGETSESLIHLSYKNMRGSQINTRYKMTTEYFYTKAIAGIVNIFIPLGNETINSSLVERGWSLMDPQLHQLLNFLVRECLSSGNRKCGSHKGKDVGCTEDVEFPSQMSEAYPSPDW